MIYIAIRILFILVFLYIIYLVIKEKLKIKYSILWIAFSIVLIVASFNIGLIEFVASKLNIYYAPAMLFLFSILFLMFYTLHLSMVVTKQEKYITNIIQELGILSEKVKGEKKLDDKDYDRKK